jgi:CheY-like chemotaxis protein
MSEKPRILVVDDENEICKLVTRILQNTELYEVYSTTVPQEVENLCRMKKPDLIILDIVMPGLSGTDLIKILHENSKTKRIKIIVTSGLGDMTYSSKEGKWLWEPNKDIFFDKWNDIVQERNSQRAAHAYGVDDYLGKPFSPDTLRQVVQDVLAKESLSQGDSLDA